MSMKPMIPGDDRPLSGGIRELLDSYRDSFAYMEASPGFMPGLWTKIEARRRVVHSFGRLATAFVTASFLICLLISGTMMTWSRHGQSVAHASYVDALVEDSSDDDFEFQLASAESR
jgi:hypothetical protein